MSTIVNDVRRGYFLDSVALMRISRNVAALPGVEEAALMMGTPANKAIMSDAGLMAAEGETAATGGDLILGIRATDASAAADALTAAADLLTAPKGSWRQRVRLASPVRSRRGHRAPGEQLGDDFRSWRFCRRGGAQIAPPWPQRYDFQR